MDEKMYTISQAELPKEKPKINEFIRSQFFKTLNVLEMFELRKEPTPEIPDNASFVVKAEDKGGCLIGVAYNTTTPTDLWDKNRSTKMRDLVEFFQYFEEQARLHELLEQGAVELWLLSVHEDWGQRGVARRLTEESERIARESGYRMIMMTCINEFTRRLAERLGWKETYRIRYQDYPRLSGRLVHINPPPPHDTLYLYVKELEDVGTICPFPA